MSEEGKDIPQNTTTTTTSSSPPASSGEFASSATKIDEEAKLANVNRPDFSGEWQSTESEGVEQLLLSQVCLK